MGSMVVHSVAKSLLILIKSGDIFWKFALALYERRIKRDGKVCGIAIDLREFSSRLNASIRRWTNGAEGIRAT